LPNSGKKDETLRAHVFAMNFVPHELTRLSEAMRESRIDEPLAKFTFGLKKSAVLNNK
jgi:hypothetical protein